MMYKRIDGQTKLKYYAEQTAKNSTDQDFVVSYIIKKRKSEIWRV